MDPLLPAFVAVLLASAIDRPPLLVAILADRYGATVAVTGAAVAQGLGFVVAAVAGSAVAPMLTPSARGLLLAFALVAAGISAFGVPRIRDRLEGWRIGGFATTVGGTAILALGDRSQFLAFAVATRTPQPVLTALGATAAAMATAAAAAALGERRWSRVLRAPLRWSLGGLFLLAGATMLVSALGLA